MKVLKVTMLDNSVWEIPASVIDEARNAYYRTREDDFEDESADDYDLTDWARNNMSWSDVSGHARCVKPATCDFQDGWVNGDMNVGESA